ncbi:MAG: hypothetical protein AAGA48_25830 [Myxococcota bacterium]
MLRPLFVAIALALPLLGHAKRPAYNPSKIWPRDFGTGGTAPHESVEETFAQLLKVAGEGKVDIDPRLSAVADALAVEEINNPERTGAEIIRQLRYEGVPLVVVPGFKRFTRAHRVVPDARQWASKLGINKVLVRGEDGSERLDVRTAANGLTIGVGSARNGRQRHWVIIVAQGRFTMSDVPRPIAGELPFTVSVPDVDRIAVYWQPAEGPIEQVRGKEKVEVTLPANTKGISVVANRANKRFEIARVNVADVDAKGWSVDSIVADFAERRKALDLPPLKTLDVKPCDIMNLDDGTALSGDRTCWAFPAYEDASLWSQLRVQPHLLSEVERSDREYLAVAQKSDELVVQFRSAFSPYSPSSVAEAVQAHRVLGKAKFNAEGSKRLDEALEGLRGNHLSEDAAQIRDDVLDASPLFQTMGETAFAVGYGARLDQALNAAVRGLKKRPTHVAVGYRGVRSDTQGYLHVVAVAAHRTL